MPKICMLAFTHYSTDSRVRREAEALVSRGDNVDFICLREEEIETARIYNGVQLFPLSIGRYRGDNSLYYLLKYFSFFIRAFFLITFLHLKKSYDIIQVHTMPDFIVFATLIPKLLGAKIILDVHDLMPELYMSKFNVNESHPLIKIIKWIERRSIAFAHRIIAVHIPHRNILVMHGNPKEKISILLNLPDFNIFGRAEKNEHTLDGKFKIIYHGTISKRHGLDVAVKAVALVIKQIPNLEFLIIGEGDYRERVLHLVNEMDLNDYIKFSNGRVPLEELPSLIKQADIGIIPILYDSFTRHMLPVKLLEYVALKIPVISSRTETIESYFNETMIRYFHPGNEVELAEHIMDLLNNPRKRELLISNAERFNRKFKWESQKKIYYNLIDSLL